MNIYYKWLLRLLTVIGGFICLGTVGGLDADTCTIEQAAVLIPIGIGLMLPYLIHGIYHELKGKI